MIDFFWLKSFTEIIQLFLSVCFVIYIKVKYKPDNVTIKWLSIFFHIKLITDLYGVLNYTSWISTILTKPILSFYRVTMGALEMGMLISFGIFIISGFKDQIPLKKGLPYYIPALILFPLNTILVYGFDNNLSLVFDFVKILWILTVSYLLIHYIHVKVLKVFALSLLFWNILWLTEVVLHQQLLLINESLSWMIFVISELIFAIGITYFFINVVTKPQILKFKKISEIMPTALMEMIKENLDNAIRDDKIYLTPDLSLPLLAEKIHVSSSDLTIYLNKVLNKNFNIFITDFRIEESKQLLRGHNNAKLTIEQIMYVSGFNSKSVFNTAFKNRTGMTPSQYRKDTVKKVI